MPPISLDPSVSLEAIFSLTRRRWLQVPPISLDPSVSLEAIFSLMNHMALELVPIVSTGGVFHGLLTRACMMRFQRKLEAEGPRARHPR